MILPSHSLAIHVNNSLKNHCLLGCDTSVHTDISEECTASISGVSYIHCCCICYEFRSFILSRTFFLVFLFWPIRGAESLRSHQWLSHCRDSYHFMEPEGSLPCLQELNTGTCPEPDESSPHPHPVSLRHFNIILSSSRCSLWSLYVFLPHPCI
jgi:hypothetical protein